MRTYFINNQYVCIKAFPSIEERNRLSKEESLRITAQRKELRDEGLRAKQEALRKAKAQNDVEPPSSMLKEVPIPSTDLINYHYLKVHKSNEVSNVDLVFDFAEIPVYTEVYDVHTNFTYVNY